MLRGRPLLGQAPKREEELEDTELTETVAAVIAYGEAVTRRDESDPLAAEIAKLKACGDDVQTRRDVRRAPTG